MGHPLFPWEPGPDDDPDAEDPRDISWIRIGRRGPRGEIEWVPKSFQPDEIGDLDDVHERFGGGVYTFVARNQRNSAISARANDIQLPGPSKPLYESKDAPPAPASPPAAPVTAAHPAGLGAITQIATVAAAVGPVLVPILEYLGAARREHQALMLELIGRSRSDQDGAARAAIEAAQSNQRVMADFFAKLAPGGGGGSLEQLVTAMQLGAQMAGAKPPGGDDDFMESLMALLGPLIQAQMQQQPTGEPAPAQLPAPSEAERVEVEG